MNFIAIDYEACKEFVLSRNLQSADYEKGKILADIVKTNEIREFSLNIKAVSINNGIYFVSKKSTNNPLLVFDKTTFKGFERNHNDVITILQKSCRLAIKIWDGIGHSPCEKIITNTSYIALFPFSFTTGKSYKVLIDKAPDKDRQEKRKEGSLLVFHDGYDISSNQPKLSHLRKAKEDFSSIDFASIFSPPSNTSPENTSYINIDTLENNKSDVTPHMGMEYWKENLTESQKKFVFSESYGPDILKGAAGTGKTLSLILRCIAQLAKAKESNSQLKAILITHSTATRIGIINLIASNGGVEYIDSEGQQSVTVTTLQEWCIENLGNRIEATEYLDKDALESKQLQLLYINEALDDFLINDFSGAKSFISKELENFFAHNDSWSASILLQEEISTYIKGRSGEDLKTYISLYRSKLSIPLINEDDFKTIFSIFNKYQEKLILLSLFDSDDITLSALKEMSTPIWKRRRISNGYDIIYIDETHLFNINELSLFHNLLKPNSNHIVFTIDRSQGIGDATITSDDVTVDLEAGSANEHGLNAVFRSSENIINLASCVLASGALLFQNLENSLYESAPGKLSSISEDSCIPYIVSKQTTNDMVSSAFKLADHIAEKHHVNISDVLIIPCTDDLFNKIKAHAESQKLHYYSIERRGDVIAVRNANENSSYIIGGMEYVGGLEFTAVIIVGIDSDKFPTPSSYTGESSHFVSYSSFNKLYVAITRAKNEVAFIHEKTQKISSLLENSLEEGLIIYNHDLSAKI
ncbi:UvrD-helicase domain-containing protein [Serratia fonticola]